MNGQESIRGAARAAVADALRGARGWLRQPSRDAVADAVVAAVEPLIRDDERARLSRPRWSIAVDEPRTVPGIPGTIAWIDEGFICAAPLPGLPDSICGEPVDLEACPEHGTYAGETP